MSLSAPRIIYGVHSVSPYSRTDKLPYGILKVIGSASIALNAPTEQLYGGSQRFSWAAEPKNFTAELSAKVKAYPGFLFAQFLGATVTDNAAEALGSVVALANFKGTSVLQATTGIATVLVKSGSEADVKFGKFVVKAVSATTVDVYLYSDIDITRGTDAVYQNDLLKITASPLTIATTTAVDIPNTGLKLTGGSGTIALVTGDTAYFSSRPENTTSTDIIVGAQASSLPAFGAVLLSMKRSTLEMVEIEAYNCVASGFPMPLEEMKFSETDVKMALVYDSVQDAVYTIRTVIPLSST